jgi:putative ABC transport system ATP-binding protein
MKPLIKVENLSVIYNLGKSSEVTAFRDANFEIYPGEYIIFFGPSGCGKSSLLYTISGIEVATTGKVEIAGKNVDEMSKEESFLLRRLKIGMIFQAFNLIPTLNILDNIILPQIFGGVPEKARKQRAMDLLKSFDIDHLASRLPSALSGGQQQRAAICRALTYSPPIIFADEPVGNLDSESAKTVMETLANLNEKEKKTIILVTHEPSYLHYAHRVMHMKDGRITRITATPEKRSIAPVKEEIASTELENLARIYPTLSEAKLKAKALSNYLLNSVDDQVAQRIENSIEKRILGEINENDLRDIFDKPFEKGGVGLYKQTAQSFTNKVEKVLSETYYLSHQVSEQPALTETDIRAQSLRMYLLDDYEGDLSFKKEEEILRLEKFIRMRLAGEINRDKFRNFLDSSFTSGGVGLNSKTAKILSRKLEVALIKYR